MSDVPQFEYVKLADRIEREIRGGKLPKGTRLPGERDMGAVYDVGIATARRAVQELRDRGLVYTLGTKGTYVIFPPDGSGQG